MTDSIQPLLERIQSEGLKQAEAERDRILEEAKEKADSVLEQARSQAKDIVSSAEKEADNLLERGKSALAQAARDQVLQLRTELVRQLQVAAKTAAGAPMASEDLLRELLPELAKRGSGSIQVEAGEALAKKLENLLPALLKDAGREAEIVMNPKTGAGFTLRFAESSEGIDFTDAAVGEWIAAYLRPELVSLLSGDRSED